MRRLASSLAIAFLANLTALGTACDSEPAGTGNGGDDVCTGEGCAPNLDAGGDLGPLDVPSPDGSEEDGGDGEVAPDVSCPGAENACGGCGTLAGEPGAACGECEDGTWRCDGTEAVTCRGGSPVATWHADADGDGFGDPDSEATLSCVAPGELFAPNDGDCNDVDRRINPGAVETCNGTDDDCDEGTDEAPDDQPECSDVCCDPEAVCDPVARDCLPPCETLRCGAELELCCDAGEICYADSCIEVGDACEYTEQCEIDEICEPSLGQCVPRAAVPACEYIPPVGEFTPRLACRWTSAGLSQAARQDVVGTPVVINLTDDNGDGVTNRNDVPDIAFLTYDLNGVGCCNVRSTLRIVSGQCNDDGTEATPATMRTIASIDTPVMTNDTGIAAADLNGDGVPELVAVGFWGRAGDDRPQGTIAFERLADDGSAWGVLWTNEDYPTWNVHTAGGATISVADLNADGDPEVVIGNVALNGQTGELLWDGLQTAPEGTTVGIGNNAFLGPASTVADVDLDGLMEVIAGNTMYEWDGAVTATFAYTTNNSTCGGDLPCDGLNAVANFDEDDEAEIVIVRLGEIFVLEHDMQTLLWRQPIPVDDCSLNEAGPPTVADFDGDGRPEVGTAGADFYVVADMDCDADVGDPPEGCQSDGILWAVPNRDCSSRVTASSVFDFEGDGRAEVIYADEQNFRIFDGRTGIILFDDATHGSHTRIEMPVIADVDDDGNAEVIIPENRSNGGQPGIDVWEDGADNWVRTRRVWNQHGYHITNITEDGTVPEVEEYNWLNERFNNYRQNVQPAGLFDAPDLTVSDLAAESEECFFNITVTVRNEGALAVAPGLPVRLEVVDDGEVVASQLIATTLRLFPGDRETLTFSLAAPEGVEEGTFAIRATVDPALAVNECDEEDNVSEIDVELSCEPKD